MIVERRIGALTEPPKNRRAYRLRVLGNVEEELGDDIERLVAEGRSVEWIADELCPVMVRSTPYPYPEAGEYRPAYDEDDVTLDADGHLVVARRGA